MEFGLDEVVVAMQLGKGAPLNAETNNAIHTLNMPATDTTTKQPEHKKQDALRHWNKTNKLTNTTRIPCALSC
eukprot:4418052-Amphidinium_carterae.2